MDNNCPQCGVVFGCGSSQGKSCWCTEFPAVMPLDATAACLCKDCLAKAISKYIKAMIKKGSHQQLLEYAAQYRDSNELQEHIDYTIEDGQYVFSSWYHLKRGSCCGNGCRHCPYGTIETISSPG